MTTVTLEVPDDLAARLISMRDNLPALLYEMLRPRQREKIAGRLRSGTLHPAYRELLDFLATGPTPDQIVAHQPAPQLIERVAELLEKNREAGLTADEEAELDEFEQVDDLMSLLKARARSIAP